MVEIGEVDDQIFDHKHVRQRGYNRGSGSLGVNGLQASHRVGSINVHGAGAAYSFPA